MADEMIQDGPPPGFVPGWLGADETQKLHAAMFPTLAQAAPRLMADLPAADGDPILLYKAFTDVLGKFPGYPAQQIGDCVSFGHGHGNDLLQCIEIALGEPSEYRETDTEFIYGESRKVAGILGPFDGSYGSAAVKAMTTVGVVSREMLGGDGAYTGSRAKSWGRTGPPSSVEQLAAPYKLGGAALVKTWDELLAAMKNGYPVTICSDQGFTMTRDSNGFCQPRGSWGHCAPPTAVVWGLEPKRAPDVRVGDRVLGHDGQLHRVIRAQVREFAGKMVTISMVGRTPVRFTDEHPMLVSRQVNTGGSPQGARVRKSRGGVAVVTAAPATRKLLWVEAADVRVGDQLVVPSSVGYGPEEVAEWRPAGNCQNVPRPLEKTADLAWLFGLYIANGHGEPGHRIVITLPAYKRDLVEKTVAALRDTLGLEPRTKEQGKHVRVLVDSAVVADSFRDWFRGGEAGEKRIPSFLFHWDLAALVDGIHAGDGDGAGLKRPKIYTTSEALREQLWIILANLGRRPALYLCSRSEGTYANAKPMWAIHFSREADWSDQPAANRTGYRDGYFVLPVKDVAAEDYAGPVYNWEVEGSNSYVADGVATHNCMLVGGVRFDIEGACILQSWGPNTPSGPTVLGQPDFSFWAPRKTVEYILSCGDSWALSKAADFVKRDIPASWTNTGWVSF